MLCDTPNSNRHSAIPKCLEKANHSIHRAFRLAPTQKSDVSKIRESNSDLPDEVSGPK